MRFKNLIALSGVFFVFVATGLPQQDPAGASGADAIAARQASLDMSSITFRSMGDAMKAGREARSEGYPAAALAKWAKALPRMFPAGTGQGETSAETQARPEIWRDRAGFEKLRRIMRTRPPGWLALAAANDTPGFTKQLEVVNQACAICHGRYKAGDQGPPRK